MGTESLKDLAVEAIPISGNQQTRWKMMKRRARMLTPTSCLAGILMRSFTQFSSLLIARLKVRTSAKCDRAWRYEYRESGLSSAEAQEREHPAASFLLPFF
jgi:hypothetical protein